MALPIFFDVERDLKPADVRRRLLVHTLDPQSSSIRQNYERAESEFERKVLGSLVTWAAGPRWWALIWFPLAFAEWFNLLSLRPLQIMYWFQADPKFRETYRLTFSAGGIRFRTASIDALIQWTHYTRMLEDRRLCLLIYGSRMFSVIPKRAFTSEAELSAFRALVVSSMRSSTASPPGSS